MIEPYKAIIFHEEIVARALPCQKIPDRGWIYFVTGNTSMENCIKIGWSSKLQKRLWRHYLQSKKDRNFKFFGALPGTRNTEISIHTQFGHLRVEQEIFENKNNEIIDWLYRNMTQEMTLELYNNICNTEISRCF